MVVMTLCPNCRSIQKAGTTCPLCKCPVARRPEPRPPSAPGLPSLIPQPGEAGRC